MRSDLRKPLLGGALAVVVLAVGSNLGGLHATEPRVRLIAAALAAVFAILGVLTTRGLAGALARLAGRTSPSAGATTRLICVLLGYLIVLGGTLGLLTVPWQHLLLGGAVTGVIAGIAAQQPLSNLFAGLLLLLSRPVAVGQWVRVHTGALGGPHDGTVADVGLIYTTLHADSETLLIPNAALLASALRYPAHDDHAITNPAAAPSQPATTTPRVRAEPTQPPA